MLLLLLLTLAVPFSSVTHASTIVVPTSESAVNAELTTVPTATSGDEKEETTVLSQTTEGIVTDDLSTVTSKIALETAENTTGPEPATVLSTVTDTPVTSKTPGDIAVPVSTSVPLSDSGAVTVYSEVTEDQESGSAPTVLVEDSEGSLSTAEVVGIVVGVLLALALVIAVVVMVVRRMGQYSP